MRTLFYLRCYRGMGKYRQAVLLVMLFLAKITYSQPISYSSLYDAGSFTRTIDISKPVGAIDGATGTSPMGAVTYSIPIQCPPGTNGLVPQIVIGYSSQAGNGPLGQGWNLSGLSSITRAGMDYYHNVQDVEPVSFTNADNFLLDGAMLYPVSPGSGGSPGANYSTEAESYAKVTSYGTLSGGPEYFKVLTKEGTIMEYGNSPDSRVMTEDGKVMLWRIYRIIDVNGNYVQFTYDNSDRDSRISKISYTGNLSGQAPYNEINFYYGVRDDKNIAYEDGYTLQSKYLLWQIEIKGEGDIFKVYQFNYGKNKGVSYLKNVQEFDQPGGTSLNDTRFLYGDATSDITESTVSGLLGSSPSTAVSSGDFDGDGLADLLTCNYLDNARGRWSTSLHVKKRSATSTAYITSAMLSFTDDYVVVENPNGSKSNVKVDGYTTVASDFNGDGRDDIAISKSYFTGASGTSSGARIMEWVRIYYTNATGGIAPVSSPDYTYSPGGTAAILKGAEDQQNYMYIGDFDGDGRSDFITILNGQLFFNSPGKSIMNKICVLPGSYTGEGLFKNADAVYVVNVDGDGKSDLMVVQDNVTRLFTFNTVVYDMHLEQIGIDLNYPTASDDIFPGDFNGDGKTDLLTGPRRDLNIYTANWHIGYSNGRKFLETPFTFDHSIRYEYKVFDALLAESVLMQADRLCVGDYNGDGKSDIYNHLYVKGAPAQHNIYYSTGSQFVQKKSNTAIDSAEVIIPADFNGDGKAEISCDNNDLVLVAFNAFDQSHLMKKANDGFNRTTEFDYGLLTYGSTGTGNFYVKGSGETYPVNNSQAPVYVMTATKVPDGLGGISTTWFGYWNLRLHRTGRGALGFEQQKSYNVNADRRSETVYELNRSFFVPWVKTQKTFRNSTETLVSEASYSNKFTGIYTGIYTYGHHRQTLDTSIAKDLLMGTTTTTVNTYDGYGNVSESTSTTTGGPETFTTKTETTYTTSAGVVIPNRPETIINRSKRGVQPEIATKSIFSYNGRGLVTTLITQPEPYIAPVNILVNNTQYDGYGNITEKKTSTVIGVIPSALWPVTTYEYDSKGRFVVKEINPMGDATTMSTHKFWGKPLTLTGPNGLTTTSTYDTWGQMTSRTIPTSASSGYTISYSDGWNLTGYQLYYTLTQDPTAPDVKVTYDIFGRPLKSEKEGFSGWTTSMTSYDLKGNVTGSTNDYYLTETPVITSFTYDPYNRISSETNVFGTTSYIYNPGSGLMKTTVTAPDGSVTATTVDASGKTISSSNGIAGTVHFQYDSRGNEISTRLGTTLTPFHNLITKEYDALGRIKKVTDADAGTTTYQYNVFGQLIKQTDPLGKITTIQYNVLGAPVSKILDGYNTYYDYYGKEKNYAPMLITVEQPSTVYSAQEFYDYNSAGNVTRQVRTVADHTYIRSMEQNFTYNAAGNLETTTYLPSGFKTYHQFDGNGYLKKITSAVPGLVRTLYEANSMNGNGQVTSFNRVDHKASTLNYYNGVLTGLYTPGVQDLVMDYNYGNGNLLSRLDNITGTKEHFQYDDISRLTMSQAEMLPSGGGPGLMHPPLETTYQNNFWGSFGRIDTKSDIGKYTYTAFPRNAVKTVEDPVSLISHATQQITYTPFHKASLITEEVGGIPYEQIFTYGPDEDRVYSHQRQGGIDTRSRWYMGDYEIDENLLSGADNQIHYISGDAGLCAIVVSEGSSGVFNYYSAYTDHLGSIVTVTDESAAVIAKQSFDPWGKERDADTWTALLSPPAKPDWLYRGFTGHEMLPEFGLINMNGRMYDPINGRMLRPDNFVQSPLDPQNYNRYSYCLNNPLKYTDPTGDLIWAPIIIGALAGAYMGGSMANGSYNPGQWDFSSSKTWSWMAGGALVGGFAGHIGGAIASSGAPFANTLGIATSSLINSVGTYVYTGSQTGISISLGIASYNFGKEDYMFSGGEFGYLGKRGNTWAENLGYAFGALANIQDGFALNNGTTLDVKSRPKLTGHSEINGQYNGKNILISVGPNGDPYPSLNGMKWESKFFTLQLKGVPNPGENVSYIQAGHPQIVTKLNNVNGKLMLKWTEKLNNGYKLLGNSKLIYGLNNGCVNFTSRALLYSGVFNFNAFLPLTSPALLNFELAIRNAGMLMSPILTTR